jgi:hypothetical protein
MASYNSGETIRKEAFILKQLQPLSAWYGTLVHHAIHAVIVPALRSGQGFPLDHAISSTIALARKQYAFSAARRYRSDELRATSGDRFCALYEHEYGVQIDSIVRPQEVLAEALTNLCHMDDILELLRSARRLDSERSLQFYQYGDRIWAKPDLIVWRQPNEITIIDWKVSESLTSDYSRQVLLYAWSLNSKVRVPVQGIKALEVNLLMPQVKDHPVDADSLVEMQDFVFDSVEQIKQIIGEEYSPDHLDELDPARNANSCIFCKFRKLCAEMMTGALST